MVAESAGVGNMIKAQAYGLGFDLVGITSLGPAETAPEFEDWLENGYAGDMQYLPRGAQKRGDTRSPFPGATHAIVVGLNYGGREPRGPIAPDTRRDVLHGLMIAPLQSLHER